MDDTVFQIAAIGVLGIGAQWLAWRSQIPAIVILLAVGLAAGPGTGFLQPELLFGELLRPLIAIAVAVILFEGGLSLNFREIRETSPSVRRLVMIGAPLAWGLGFLAARYLAGLEAPTAAILAGILVVTGPTVIMPLLRQARLPQRPASLLRWEAILADPLGALFAVVAFEVTIAFAHDHALAAVGLRLALAVVAGLGLGILLARVMVFGFVRGYVPEFLKAPIMLVAVLVGFEATNLVLEEAGLLTVTVMGVVIANSRIASLDEIRRFKEVMTVILVSGVFVVLTATVRLDDLAALGWRDLVFLAALLFLVRPASVLLSTLGTRLGLAERLLCAWIAPRGVVAVAVSGLFGQALASEGVADAARLAPLAFLVVFATVILHGFSIGPVARALGLTAREPPGLLIVGGSPWVAALGKRAAEIGLPVLIADTNWNHLQPARLAGLPVYFGEILSEATEHHLDLSRYDALIAATDNDAYNALVCTDLGPEIGRAKVYQIGQERAGGKESGKGTARGEQHRLSFTLGGRTLFRDGSGYHALHRRLAEGWTFQATRLSEAYDYEAFLAARGEDLLVLFAQKPSGRLVFSTTAERIKAEPGDTVLSFGPKPAAEEGGA